MADETNQKAAAPKFEWDFDIPDDPFWSDMEMTVARNFLTCYDTDEVAKMHFDASLSVPDRLRFLLAQLTSSLSAREAAAAAAEAQDSTHVLDPASRRRFLLGIQTMQKFLGLFVEEAQTIRKTLATTDGGARVPWLNMLADLDLRNGDYAEAEALAREVLPWMQNHEKLGRDSPQALGTTRILIQSMWRQGVGKKEDEARRLMEETFVLIDGMGEGKFAKYQEEEREMLQDLQAKLKAGKMS